MKPENVFIKGGNLNRVLFYEYYITLSDISSLNYDFAPVILREGNIRIVLEQENTNWYLNIIYKKIYYKFYKVRNTPIYTFCHTTNKKLPKALINFIDKLSFIEKIMK